ECWQQRSPPRRSDLPPPGWWTTGHWDWRLAQSSAHSMPTAKALGAALARQGSVSHYHPAAAQTRRGSRRRENLTACQTRKRRSQQTAALRCWDWLARQREGPVSHARWHRTAAAAVAPGRGAAEVGRW